MEKAIWKGSHNPRGLKITMATKHVSESWDDPPSRMMLATPDFIVLVCVNSKDSLRYDL